MKVSVIICTHNGSERLKKTLKSLAEMEGAHDLDWELIVVDNNSTDNTKELVHDFAGTSKLNVRYSFEVNQGLSHARNKGIHEARGELVAYTDDDCIVDKYWLTSIINEFASDPALSLLGGRVELYNKQDKPVTIYPFKDRTLFSSLNQLFILIPGCNMIMKKDVINAVGNFDTDFGAGSKFISAEDSDFFYRAYKKGYKIAYTPRVLIYHNHGRSTDEQVRTLHRGYVIGRGAFYCKYILRGEWDVIKLACQENVSRIQSVVKKILHGNSIDQDMRYSYYLMLGAIYKISAIIHNATRCVTMRDYGFMI